MVSGKTDGAKYLQIAGALERDILAGRFIAGEKLPGERELARRFGVANLTLRQALRLLADKKLIRSHHGKGNFVNEARFCRAYLARKKRVLEQKSILVFGMHATAPQNFNPINLSAALMRYRGIVETAFLLNLPVQTLDFLSLGSELPRLPGEYQDANGAIILDNDRADGIIAVCAASGLPAVLISSGREKADCGLIRIDAAAGIRLAVEHLLAAGHRRIGFAGGGPDTPSNRNRYEAYTQALAEARITPDPELTVRDCRGFPEEGEAACAELMRLDSRPTAIIAASDYRAIGILRRALALGIRVPEDLRIIGYDDIPETRIQNPALSTVHNPLYESGVEAVNMLWRNSEPDATPNEIKILQPELIIRET